MTDIPVELKDILKKGECALFVGSGLSEGLPQWKELLTPLALEFDIDIEKEKDLRNIASYYEGKHGREKLLEYIILQLDKDVKLTKTHEILRKLPLKAIVTTNYDHVLEKALTGKNVVKIVYGTEAPSVEAGQLPLIKMHGDLDDPSTIIIAKKDYSDYAEKHKAMITYFKGLLISCNFLFVGFSLEDQNFETIFGQVKSIFGESMRKSFAILPNPPEYEVKRLKDENGIEVIPITDYNEVPEIFEEFYSICGEKWVKTELTSWERDNIYSVFRDVVGRQNKWLDPRGIFQFERMLTRKDVELEDVYVVPRLAKQVTARKEREEREEREERRKEEREEREEDKMDKHLEIRYNIEGDLESREKLEEYSFEKQKDLSLKNIFSTPEHMHMVILGDPGVGKTCLLQYIALKVSTNSEEFPGVGKVLPVLIPLREYAKFGRNKPLREFIFYYIENRICSLPKDILDDFLEKNSFFFLFDGLDEVVSESERIGVSRQVEQFMAQYPRTRIVLTSRPAGYKAAALIGAIPHFTLAEFNDDEIKEFLQKWFAFLEKVEKEGYNPQEIAGNLFVIIKDREKILSLARNPLLLTILVLIHRLGKRLPERRAEFYEYAVKTIAGTWEDWKNLHADKKIPDQEVILAILEKIGFKLHDEKERNVVEDDELKTWLKEALQEEVGHSSREEVNDFIWMLKERAGLLVERGLGLYGFVHLTFQEYFAARYIAWGRGTSLAYDLIRKKLYSSRWREVILLAAATAFPQQAESVFESILKAENNFEEYIHSNLLFAGLALADQPRVKDSKRKEIIERLIHLTGPDNIDVLRADAFQVLVKIRKVFQFEDKWAWKLLSDEYEGVRKMAVQYFTTIGAQDTEIRDRIFTLLTVKDGDVRKMAAQYFTTIGAQDTEIRDRIFTLLTDKEWDVREMAVQYFTTIGAQDTEIRDRIFTLLTVKEWDVREMAVQYFTTIGAQDTEIRDRIFTMLTDEDGDVRKMAAQYFITIGAQDTEIRDKFFTLLTVKDGDVRKMAAQYFTTLGAQDTEIRDKFFTMLTVEEWDVREIAVRYFTTLGAQDTEIRDKFSTLLTDEEWDVHEMAVQYFTTIGAQDTEIRDRIFTLLTVRDWGVQNRAVEYLSKFARKESMKKAPSLFKSRSISAKRGAYKLMKNLLTS